ncbi:MAG: hypothetical protein AAF380_00785 [Bacteroidota bacterium]
MKKQITLFLILLVITTPTIYTATLDRTKHTFIKEIELNTQDLEEPYEKDENSFFKYIFFDKYFEDYDREEQNVHSFDEFYSKKTHTEDFVLMARRMQILHARNNCKIAIVEHHLIKKHFFENQNLSKKKDYFKKFTYEIFKVAFSEKEDTYVNDLTTEVTNLSLHHKKKLLRYVEKNDLSKKKFSLLRNMCEDDKDLGFKYIIKLYLDHLDESNVESCISALKNSNIELDFINPKLNEHTMLMYVVKKLLPSPVYRYFDFRQGKKYIELDSNYMKIFDYLIHLKIDVNIKYEAKNKLYEKDSTALSMAYRRFLEEVESITTTCCYNGYQLKESKIVQNIIRPLLAKGACIFDAKNLLSNMNFHNFAYSPCRNPHCNRRENLDSPEDRIMEYITVGVYHNWAKSSIASCDQEQEVSENELKKAARDRAEKLLNECVCINTYNVPPEITCIIVTYFLHKCQFCFHQQA